jgi:hypothetical protein
MNDEILLTPREIELETERAIAAWNDSRPEQVPSREEFVLAWGCRAQVKKVVEWLEKNNQATAANLSNPPIDGEGIYRGWDGYRIYEGELMLRVDQLQALKQAAGEGK